MDGHDNNESYSSPVPDQPGVLSRCLNKLVVCNGQAGPEDLFGEEELLHISESLNLSRETSAAREMSAAGTDSHDVPNAFLCLGDLLSNMGCGSKALADLSKTFKKEADILAGTIQEAAEDIERLSTQLSKLFKKANSLSASTTIQVPSSYVSVDIADSVDDCAQTSRQNSMHTSTESDPNGASRHPAEAGDNTYTYPHDAQHEVQPHASEGTWEPLPEKRESMLLSSVNWLLGNSSKTSSEDITSHASFPVQDSGWLKLSGNPSSWGVESAVHPFNPAWDKVIKCISDVGYAGTELGPMGYYDTELLEEMLKKTELQLVAGSICEKLHEPDQLETIIAKTQESCAILKRFGAKFLVISPHTHLEKEAFAGCSSDAPRLSHERWIQMMGVIREVAQVVKSYDMCCVLHPQAGSWIEYEDEIEQALTDLPADLVALCLDTGHCTYAGMDVAEKFKQHAERIPYMKFTDVDVSVLKTLQEEKGTLRDGVSAGLFRLVGKGGVNFHALLIAMQKVGFSGFATVEQPKFIIKDKELQLRYPLECCKQSVRYLQNLAVSNSLDDIAMGA